MDEFYRTLGTLETREDALDEVSAARIAARMDAARRKTPGLKRRRLVVLIAAAALVLTACTAAVAHYTDWFSYLRPYGSEKNAEAMFGDMGMVIGETVTDGETGVSVTLDGCLYDGRRLALALTVEGGAAAENLDGRTYTYTVANNTGQYLLSLTRRETIEAIAAEAGGDILQDEEEQARWMYSEPVNTIYLRTDEARPEVLHLEIVTDLQIIQADDEVLLHLEDLTHQDEVIAPGAWEFTFTLPPRTMGRYYQGETAVDTPEGAVTVYAAAVEPSYVSIGCDGPYRENAWSLTIERVRLTDGTIVPIHDSQVRAMTGEEGVMRVTEIQGSYQDWQFVSPADVEALCLGEDSWIALSELEAVDPPTEGE